VEPRKITSSALYSAGDYIILGVIFYNWAICRLAEKEIRDMNMTELKERTIGLMGQDVTLGKLDFMLFGTVMLLAGICLGLLAAPVTHGIAFGSFNGCHSGNHYAGSHGKGDEDQEA